MSGKKKILLVVVILLIGVAFIGIGVAVTNSTVKDTQTTEASENEDKKSSTTGNVGDKEAAEKLKPYLRRPVVYVWKEGGYELQATSAFRHDNCHLSVNI